MAVADFGGVDQHRHLAGLAEDNHKQYALILQDAIALRPATVRAGTFFYATDEKKWYFNDGTDWSAAGATGSGGFARLFLHGGN